MYIMASLSNQQFSFSSMKEKKFQQPFMLRFLMLVLSTEAIFFF